MVFAGRPSTTGPKWKGASMWFAAWSLMCTSIHASPMSSGKSSRPTFPPLRDDTPRTLKKFAIAAAPLACGMSVDANYPHGG
jgi:hypothetical protein